MFFDNVGSSVGGSLFFIAVYLGLCAYHRQTPELAHAVTLSISCSSVLAALKLAHLAYLSSPDELGVLKDSRGSILIGALVVIWVSVSCAISSFRQPLRNRPSGRAPTSTR